MELKLSVIAMVNSCCAIVLYCHGFHVRFRDKILPISAECFAIYWVHISDQYYLI